MPDQAMRGRISLWIINGVRWILTRSPVRGWRCVRYLRSLPLAKRLHKIIYGFGFPAHMQDVDVRYRGLRLTGPVSEFSVIPALLEGYYEELEISLFERFAAVSRTILDVGAHIGLYACVGATLLPPGGRVIAFEPIPQNLGYLRRNITGNGLGRTVTVEPVAVGAQDGEVTIRWGRNVASVPMCSLDSYADTHDIAAPDIIKIDVEGFDGQVLWGARTLIQRARPAVFVEFLPGLLLDRGFEPDKFLDIIFGLYSEVFVIDEPCQRLTRCAKSDLALLQGRNDPHSANLLAVGRPEHLRIVRERFKESDLKPGPCFARGR